MNIRISEAFKPLIELRRINMTRERLRDASVTDAVHSMLLDGATVELQELRKHQENAAEDRNENA